MTTDIQNGKPFTRSTFDDVAGIKTSVATAITQQIYGTGGTALDGNEVTFKTAGRRLRPRSVTITTAAHTGSYKTGGGNAIVVTGTYKGAAVSENLSLTAANGGETVRGAQLFDDPTLVVITVPGQNDALGSFQFGVGDIGGSGGKEFRAVKAHASATLVVRDGDGVYEKLVVSSQAVEPVIFARLCVVAAGVTTTASIGVTLYE